MRTSLDFTPFYRSSIGFDRMFNLLENASRLGTASGLPAYDIVRAGEDTYRIVLAVPGFSMNDLEISQEPNLLLISGNVGDRPEQDYLHRGIDSRSFTQRFELADYVEVVGAHLADGLLTIELKRELPEAMKPRRIQIAGPMAQDQKQIESGPKKAA
jgi:molecular chaperone IbpA